MVVLYTAAPTTSRRCDDGPASHPAGVARQPNPTEPTTAAPDRCGPRRSRTGDSTGPPIDVELPPSTSRSPLDAEYAASRSHPPDGHISNHVCSRSRRGAVHRRPRHGVVDDRHPAAGRPDRRLPGQPAPAAGPTTIPGTCRPTGHRSHDPLPYVDQLIAHRLEREGQILGLLGVGRVPPTPDELVAAMSARGPRAALLPPLRRPSAPVSCTPSRAHDRAPGKPSRRGMSRRSATVARTS